MKKHLLKILTLILALCALLCVATACGGGDEHIHVYDQKNIDAKYKKSDATCEEKEMYYFSCSCGEKGEKTFEVGSALGHDYTQIKFNQTAHWYECSCGKTQSIEAHKGGIATIYSKAVCEICNQEYGEKLTETHEHNYNQLKFNDIQHWKECICGDKKDIAVHNGLGATCTKNAVCAICGTPFGSLKAHNYNQLKFNEVEHWLECVCGDKQTVESHRGGEATCTKKAVCEVCNQEHGQTLPHYYKTEKHNQTEHWLECVCGDKNGVENHIPGEPATETTDQTCKECDRVLTPSFGHVHKLHLTFVVAKEESCTKEGNKEYYVCSCEKWFWDSEATQEIADMSQIVTQKLAHEYNELKYTENKHWYECECGEKEQEAVHGGGEATCTIKAVCSGCNQPYGNLLSHEYDNLRFDTTSHWYECVCGEKQTTEEHKGGEATCTKKAVCSMCTQSYGELLDHEYDSFKFDTTSHWYECVCGEKQTVENHKGREATCTQKAKCEVCDQEYGNIVDCKYESGSCKWCRASEGLKYVLINNDTEYEVSVGTCTATNVFIASTHKGKPITSIGYRAFVDCDSLTSVTIPNSVTSIGEDAFSNCDLLQSVEIGNSVESIGDYAFEDCNSLTSVVIPDSVTSIGFCAFSNCDLLQSVEIGNSVESIGGYAFEDCDSLTSVTIPNSVTSIGYRAFVDCDSLTSVTIPNSVTSIGEDAFSNCDLLQSVEIGNSVESIGAGAFYKCISLQSIQVDSANEYYKSIDGNLYSKDCKTLIQYAIGKTATSFSIPNSVKYIDSYAFNSCNSLQSVIIPNSVESMGSPFSSLDAFTIYCEASSKPKSWNSDWNYSCHPVVWDCNNNDVADDGYIYTVVDGVRYALIDGKAIVVNQSNSIISANIQSSIIHKGNTYVVITIGNDAFSFCDSLQSVVIPNSVRYIDSDAFFYCTSLQSVEIGNGVESIGWSAFNGCSSLISVTIGSRVTSKVGLMTIGNDAFKDCTSLKFVVIPNHVKSIGDSAFYNCKSLNYFTFSGTKEQWNTITKGVQWGKNLKATYVQCSDGKVDIY